MRKAFVLPFFLLIGWCVHAQDSLQTPRQTIIRFFKALSELKPEAMRAEVTADFVLVENGKIEGIDSLIASIQPFIGRNIQRVNSFQFVTETTKGDVAWISYDNRADLKQNEREMTMRWLESAVLVKEKGHWKISLLHSTRQKETTAQ
ncbi:MAG TPA: nuclear transport factor 2 family protein [Flavisolibacter sp.]|jgi:hypothetical protein|nr:nuclear transport factor 2 family protein [Flavisolibacter sp.]